MEQDEREICAYLKTLPGQFVSARDIARRAGGKRRHQDDPYWAAPVLARLLDKKVIETDSTHHYRLVIKEDKKKRRKWISPQMKRILESSGKIHVIEDEDDPTL